MKKWVMEHRRMLVLKLMVALLLTIAHFYPQSMPALLVNLIWVFLI